ncbi:hypothetical protein R3P38DRAFT_3221598 [Favolaschia claudopus]|uniref:Uncharacterized protein n=1 Tax=Favolaschia claudopus TaxID=2862362 RepID=A0AAW0A0H5_9AGAR
MSSGTLWQRHRRNFSCVHFSPDVALTPAATAALVFLAIAEHARISSNSSPRPSAAQTRYQIQLPLSSLSATRNRDLYPSTASIVSTVPYASVWCVVVDGHVAIIPMSRRRGGPCWRGEDRRGRCGRVGDTRDSMLPRHHPRLLQIIPNLLDIHGPRARNPLPAAWLIRPSSGVSPPRRPISSSLPAFVLHAALPCPAHISNCVYRHGMYSNSDGADPHPHSRSSVR